MESSIWEVTTGVRPRLRLPQPLHLLNTPFIIPRLGLHRAASLCASTPSAYSPISLTELDRRPSWLEEVLIENAKLQA